MDIFSNKNPFNNPGIEAEAVMLGQAISMLLPEVIGYHITGSLDQYATSTDLVLTITKVGIIIAQLGCLYRLIILFRSICGKLVLLENLSSSLVPAWPLFPSQTGLPFPTCAPNTEPPLASSLWMKQPLRISDKQVSVLFLVNGNALMSHLTTLDRAEDKISAIEAYLRASKMMRNYSDSKQNPKFTQVI